MKGTFKYSLIYLILSIVACIPHATGQKAVAKGDRFFDQNQFSEAIEFYKKETRSRNRKVKEHATQRLADCYRITGDFIKAEGIYKKILSRNRKSPLAYLNYGIALMNGARYPEASNMFREYLTLVPGDRMGQVYLQSCDSAQKWLDETLGREVRNLYEINTEESEFAPVTIEGRLVFLSARKGSTRKLVSFDGGGDVRRLDFYTIGVYEILKNKGLQALNDINTYAHEGPACYSPDGTEMYFTKTVKGSRDDYKNEVVNTLQVFRRTKDKNGAWSEPVNAFDFNSLEYSVGHPAMTPDGNRIYFMSDMPGGFGNTDIYYTQKQGDGSWGKPRNAGDRINTFAHEMFPAVSDEGMLYFASNGHPGMGQLDIFSSALADGVFSHPRNLRPPVNSIANDFGISFYEGSERGFVSSDRFNGKGAEDIYAFADERPLEVRFAESTIILNDYSLFDNITYELLDSTATNDPVLNNVNGKLIATIDEKGTYIIVAKQYGMVINKLYFRFIKDWKEKAIAYHVYSTDRPVRVSGLNFLGLHHKSAKPKRDPKKTYSNLKGNRFAELYMSIDKTGVFTFKVELEAGTRNVISSLDVPDEKENVGFNQE